MHCCKQHLFFFFLGSGSPEPLIESLPDSSLEASTSHSAVLDFTNSRFSSGTSWSSLIAQVGQYIKVKLRLYI